MDTAVLFETFARPQYARQVFDQIKKAKPKKLYFYSNKARVDRPDEVRNNEEIRSWVKEVDAKRLIDILPTTLKVIGIVNFTLFSVKSMWMFILRFVVQWTGYLIMKNRQ